MKKNLVTILAVIDTKPEKESYFTPFNEINLNYYQLVTFFQLFWYYQI